MNEIAAYFLDALLAVLLGLAVRYLIPYCRARIAAERLSFVRRWVDSLVAAAEQTITGSRLGPTRKAWVLSMLEHLEIGIDAGTDALIEAAVKALNTASSAASDAALALLHGAAEARKGGEAP